MTTAAFVWAACVFDFFDGFAARLLGVSSPIGKELDSLADMVSFGLLPALLMFTLIGDASAAGPEGYAYFAFAALLVAVFSALRLAIFNVDENQKDSFRGLPTPANALFLTAIPALEGTQLDFFLRSTAALTSTAVIFSFLLVAPIELFALKFKSFRWSENTLRFTFLALSGLLLVTLKLMAIPLIIILYILMSLGVKVFSR